MTLSRRSALAAAGLLGAAACTGASPAPAPRPVDPDVALRQDAISRERALLARYDALLAADPALRARLAPVRSEHERHLEALGQPPAPSGSAVAPAVPSAVAPAVPSATAGTPTLAALIQAERTTATAHAAATATASPGLAAVLAQLAASEASHPVALG